MAKPEEQAQVPLPAVDSVTEQPAAAEEGKPVGEEQPHVDSWWKDTRIWINIIGYVSVTAALVIIQIRPDFMPSVERGYNCKDPSLQFPKRPDSVRLQTLIISTVSILLISVFISEGVYAITPEYTMTPEAMLEPGASFKDKVFLFINLVTSKLLYGYLGLILTMTFTYHLQHMTSCFRPDFLGVCDPKPSHCQVNTIGYFVHCQQTNKELLADSRMSFPSEFASISFYMVIFSSMIIERAISGEFFALKLAVQSSYIFWAIYLTGSRIKDNKNHPIDCFGGFMLGTFVALYMDSLASYADYNDQAYYDPNITLNIQDWEEGGDMMQGDEQTQQDYAFR